MTTRSDLPRLGASLGVLGTLLEHKGQLAYDTMDGWQQGPRKAPQAGERGGGGSEAEAEDRKDEQAQRARAARHFQLFRTDLAALDELVQSLIRRMDVAVPPHPAEARNSRTGELDPITPAEAVIVLKACRSCWRNNQERVDLIAPAGKSGVRKYRDYCKWCGEFKAHYGIEPPVELLQIRHAIPRRNVLQADIDAAMAKHAASLKSKKKGKRKKGKAVAA